MALIKREVRSTPRDLSLAKDHAALRMTKVKVADSARLKEAAEKVGEADSSASEAASE